MKIGTVQLLLEIVADNFEDRPKFEMFPDGSGEVSADGLTLFGWDQPYEIYLEFGYWLFDGEMPSPESVMQTEYAVLVRGEGEQVMSPDFQEAWITWLDRVHEQRGMNRAEQ